MKKYDYTKLKEKIIAKYNKLVNLKIVLHLCDQQVYNKLENRSHFTYEEIDILIKDLDIKDEEIREVFFKEVNNE